MGSPHRHRAALAWALSVAFHVEALILGAGLLAGEEGERAPVAALERGADAEIAVGLELPPADGLAATEAARPIPAGGSEIVPRPDGDQAGRGGQSTVDVPAINLSPRDDQATLTRTLTSGHDHAQQARRRTAVERRSPEDDTVIVEPMILTFFAVGEGTLPKPHSRARELARTAPDRDTRQARLSTADRPSSPPRENPSRSSPTHRADAAESAPSRPMALAGRTSTPADEVGPQADTTDGSQEIDAREPSLLSASTAGGEAGIGRGGETAPGATGSGGEAGRGSRSRAQGNGRGQGPGFSPGDLYLRRAYAKIQASWSADSFPRQAVIEGRGGTTIVAYTITEDGSVRDVAIIRPSGFPSFDAAMRQAVYRAAPFGPLPEALGSAVRRTHEFTVVNPAVR